MSYYDHATMMAWRLGPWADDACNIRSGAALAEPRLPRYDNRRLTRRVPRMLRRWLAKRKWVTLRPPSIG